MGSIGPEGIRGISDTFANTLWTFNFFLYAATVQVSSVQLHSTQTSWSAPWQPIPFLDMQPHVRSCYYAYAAIAQLIGAQCSTRVSSINIDNLPSQYDGRLAAYGIYTGEVLTGLALVNTQTSNATNPSGNSVDFSFTLPNLAYQTFYLSHLIANGTDSKKNTTWNGMSFETLPNGQPETVNRTLERVTGDSNGQFTINVRDGSALVANLGSRLGANPVVNQTACAALSKNGEGGDSVPNGTNSGSAPTFRSTTGFHHKGGGGLGTGGIIALAVAIPVGVILLATIAGITAWLLIRRRRRARAAAEKGSGSGEKLSPTNETTGDSANSGGPSEQSRDSTFNAPPQHIA